MRSCTSLFFGLFFIVIGLNIILRYFFKISIPFMKILFALFFIYIGLTILLGKPFCRSMNVCENGESVNMFSSTSYEFKDKQIDREKLSVVFGSIEVDLSGIKIEGDMASIKADCVFGSMNIQIDKGIPVRINGSSAFGQITLPGNNKATFGSAKYESEGFSEDKPYLEIEASVVFGELVIR